MMTASGVPDELPVLLGRPGGENLNRPPSGNFPGRSRSWLSSRTRGPVIRRCANVDSAGGLFATKNPRPTRFRSGCRSVRLYPFCIGLNSNKCFWLVPSPSGVSPAEFRLYWGATPGHPIDGMFSFAPAAFERPDLGQFAFIARGMTAGFRDCGPPCSVWQA
jgi:hypothetical protein